MRREGLGSHKQDYPRGSRLTPRASFDRAALLVVLGIGLAIVLTILRGDHVGVQILRTTPIERAGHWSVITMQFSEAMQRDSVVERLRFEPTLPGEVTWAGARLIYRPAYGLEPGKDYTVVLEPGAESESGRKVLEPHRFQFSVLGPRVAYLSPEDGATKDIWMRDAAGLTPPERVTNSKYGIVAFDVSPDGSRIAFAERKDASVATDLKFLDLDTREVRPLTNCGEFVCTTPVWSPDGNRLAYERMAYSQLEPGLATSSSRVWLLEPDTNPPLTRPLFGDTQTPPNYKPRWSPDGRLLAVSQLPLLPNRNPGLVLVDLTDESTTFLPTNFGSMGVFAPEGARMIYPGFAVQDGEMRTVLQLADLRSGDIAEVPGLTQAHETLAEWLPDGSTLVVSRRTTATEQYRGRQLYLLQPGTGALQPFILDPAFDHSYFAWDPTGQQLLLQRSQVWTGGPEVAREQRSQVWTYDAASGTPSLVAINAFFPRWVP